MRVSRPKRPPTHALAAVGIWLVAATVFAFFAGRVSTWYLMTDELLYERLAITVSHWHSPLPRIHGELIPSLNQLYPLVISPAFAQSSVPEALHDAHVLNAFVMASVAVPVLLLTRRVTGSDRIAALVAVLTLCVPWMVYASFLLTEVVAYPIFAWALLALQRATVTPRARNDLVALGTIAVAVLARTQFTILLVVLPVGIVLYELGRAGGASRGERLVVAARCAATLHRPVSAVVAVVVVAVAGLVAVGRLDDSLGTYGTTVKGDLVPDGMARSFAEHVATLGLGLGILPFVVGVAWLLSSLVAKRTAEERAFAALGVPTFLVLALQVTAFDLRFGEGKVIDRYLIYLVPLVLIAFGAALSSRSWPRFSLLWPTAVLAIGLALVPLTVFEAFNTDQAVAALNGRLETFAGSLGAARIVLVAGSAIAAVLFLQAAALLRSRSVAIAVAALALAGAAAQTANAFVALFQGDREAGRPLTGPQPSRLGWIDAAVGADAEVTMIPYPRVLQSYAKSLERAWDTEFWNMSVRHTAVDVRGAFSWTPTGTFPTIELRFDERSGIANTTITELVAASERDARFRLAGRVTKVADTTMLIETERPWRAEWLSRGLTDDGWTTPDAPASIRIFARPGDRRQMKRYISFQVRAPNGVAVRPFAIRSNMVTWNGTASGKSSTQGQLQVCVPAGGFADVWIAAEGHSPTHGDPITGASYNSGPREVGIGFLQVALADEVGGTCSPG